MDLEFVEAMRKIATVTELTVAPAAHATHKRKNKKDQHIADIAHTRAVGNEINKHKRNVCIPLKMLTQAQFGMLRIGRRWRYWRSTLVLSMRKVAGAAVYVCMYVCMHVYVRMYV